jgi:hypothetical protein
MSGRGVKYKACPVCEGNFPLKAGQNLPPHKRQPTDAQLCAGTGKAGE